jgi:hypothetical protein
VGSGEINVDGAESGLRDAIRLPPSVLIAPAGGQSVANLCTHRAAPLIRSVFDAAALRDTDVLRHRAILTPYNEDALQVNESVLQLLGGELQEYRSLDRVVTEDPDDEHHFPLEFLHSLTPAGMPPHRLRLKVGAVVMLLRNLSLTRRLCNGSRFIVRRLHPHRPVSAAAGLFPRPAVRRLLAGAVNAGCDCDAGAQQ